MPTVQRVTNLLAVIVPFLAVIAAVVLLWNDFVGVTDLAIAGVMYVSTAFGVTIGFHRLLTHRAFNTYRPIQYVLAALGSMSVQGPVIHWVADHRKHHAHTDQEGDPHSPHHGFGGGLRGSLRGLAHAHVGWLINEQGRADRRRYAKDLVEDPGMRTLSRAFPALVALSLGLPFALGYLLTGTLAGALTALLWGGFVRIFLLHHVTWSINSLCHFLGRRRFDIEDESTNLAWLALPSLGEAWHHNHHAFPRAAVQGMRWWEVDPSGLVIRTLRGLGLAWNVVVIDPERQRAKEVGAAS